MVSTLNAPQREAVSHLDGPLLVLAGAGSGKTRVITQKIAHLIQQCGYAPGQIAALTFTNKAAKEMRARARQLLPGQSLESLNVSTFHALGARILREEAERLSLKPCFSIFDATDSGALLAELAGEADRTRLKALQWRISGWKSALVEPDEALSLAEDELGLAAARLYADYEKALRAYQAVDFDDLIRLPVRLLASEADVLLRWQGKLQYLLVDEYQDTNRSQYRLLRLLAGERAAFTVVGDDDQAIYAWRGADLGNLRQLQQDYPQLRVIKLEQNYRSTTRILKAANALIAHNPKLFDKRLWSAHGHGDAVEVRVARDEEEEAEQVVMKLLAHRFAQRGRWGDYAILYRSNHQARLFEQQLRNRKIPYAISGGQSFFDKAEIRDLLAWLRLLANSDDDPAFIRAATAPRRGIGATTLEGLGRLAGVRHASLFAAAFDDAAAGYLNPKQLQAVREFGELVNRFEWRARREPARQVLEDFLRAIAYEVWLFDSCDPSEAQTKWANVRDFVDWLSKKGEEEGKTLLELTQTVALISMLDKSEDAGDQVQLATLHAAKGLEFKHVFLVGVEEGLLPHRESVAAGMVEEERRLMYVGITRARRSLTLSYCERRRSGGQWRECEPSRFIAEMGDDLKLSGGKAAAPADRAAAAARLAQLRTLLTGAGTRSGA